MTERATSPWLEAVRSPLLLLNPERDVVAVNRAAGRLLDPSGNRRLPCKPQSLLGEAAGDALVPLLQAEGAVPKNAVTCRVPGLAGDLTLLPRALREPAEHWLVTIEALAAGPESAADGWRRDLEAILNSLPVGLSIYDRDGREVFENEHAFRIFGYDRTELSNLSDWWPIGYPDPVYRELARNAWYDAAAETRRTKREILMNDWAVTCKDGSQKMIQFRFRAMGDNNVVVFWDVTAQRRLETELRQLADTDNLTGLINRRRFFEEAASLLQARLPQWQPLSLLMLDLDHFKEVNDRHGHATGDIVLQGVADRCRRMLRENDLMARIGGEEFAILLPDTARLDAERVAERLRAAVASEVFDAPPVSLDIRVSIGGATATPRLATIGQLLELADRSLYDAKRAGRDRVHFAPGEA